MFSRRLNVLFLLILAVVFLPAFTPAAQAKPAQTVFAPLPPVMTAFNARLDYSKKNLPTIITAAEAAAKRIAEHPKALIDVPYGEQPTFAEEILNRAGGLADALPSVERPNMVTSDDIMLLAVRSWDVDGAKIMKLMDDAKKQGWLVILFASKKGTPKDAQYAYLVDNGGGANKDDAAMNAIANALNSWLWTCEYTAALTRLGKYPGILQSMVVNGSEKHNGFLQSRDGRLFLDDCTDPIPAGELAGEYFKRIDLLVTQVLSSTTQRQITRSAAIAAAHLKAGKTVMVASCEHILLSDIFNDNKTAWKPINVVWQANHAFKDNVKQGDLVIFFGYIGLSTVSEDYGKYLRETGADIIASYITDNNNPSNNAVEGLCVITQHWRIGDGEINIPFAPGVMAPCSGLEAALLYRMLDDATAKMMTR